MVVTEGQRDFYHANGYVAVPGVLDPERVLEPVEREYAALLDALCRDWEQEGRYRPRPGEVTFEDRILSAYAEGCDWFQPMDISLPGDRIEADTPMHFGPAVFGLLTAPRLLDLVEELIGPEITSNPIQHVRIKPPVSALREGEVRAHVGGTDWHQDRGVAHEEADSTHMITVWCAVTDATVENGCLQVMPGRHGREMLPHCPQRQLGIAPGFIDEREAVPVPVPRGGVLVLHPLTPHASLDNVSDGIRWSFDLRYSRTGEPTGRAHFPEFVARSRAEPERVLSSWTEWRAMWERARARLAGEPHIDIHRWQADAPYCA